MGKTIFLAFTTCFLIFIFNMLSVETAKYLFLTNVDMNLNVGFEHSFLVSSYDGINFWLNERVIPEHSKSLFTFFSYFVLGFIPFFLSFFIQYKIISNDNLPKFNLNHYSVLYFIFIFIFYLQLFENFQQLEFLLILLPNIFGGGIGITAFLIVKNLKKNEEKKENK
jgi:predicted membrane-bound mannosyltransferase